ncbi:hypothetical protein B0J14DRAFT_605291 [Halenospora varia]|nr:hypothetical protein B0J14DRAFT_605291 [Halenospora varia]
MCTALNQSSPELSAALQDINTINQVIQARTFPPHPPPLIPEPGRPDLNNYLKRLTEHFWLSDYRARTWGFTILRTAYRPDDDSKFQHGIDVINQTIKMWNEVEKKDAAQQMTKVRVVYEATKADWPAGMPETANGSGNRQFWERFVCDIIEDREALEGASVSQICDYFKTWALAHWHGNPAHISAGSPRLKSCIVLDEETMDHLQLLPLEISVEHWISLEQNFWVKVAEAYPEPRYYPDSMTDCYRVRLADVVEFWFAREWSEPSKMTKTMEGQPEEVFWWQPWGKY